MVIQVVPQMKGEPGVQGPHGVQGPQGSQGPGFVEEARLTLDKRIYVQGVDDSIAVYGSGFARDEFVLPQIQGANPRGFTAKEAYADANGTFSTTISLVTEGVNVVDTTISLKTELTMTSSGFRDDRVQPGVYTLRVTGGEGTLMTTPVVIGEK
jgi:hypothetical protein